MLVTGASGFVGAAVVRHAATKSWRVRAAARRPLVDLPAPVELVCGGDLAVASGWSTVLDGVEAVVHCAARVHVMRETAADPLAAFRATNVAGTARLARQAAAAGARRFVYLSSLHVNGNETFDRPFTAADTPAPRTPYAVSKLEAEVALGDIATETGLEVVVLRPPLVFGPGVAGNFAQLMRALYRRLPLPFGAIGNRRSLVGLDNLVDLILVCARHPQAAGRTFLVSDGEDLSTPELLRRTAAALGVRAGLLPVPAGALRALAALVGKGDIAQRLCGSLQVDMGATRKQLGWSPPCSVDAQLRRTADHFLANLAPG